MIVLKFGGTSMGSPATIKSVSAIIGEKIKSKKLLVTVSAMAGVTDKLISMAESAGNHSEGFKAIMEDAQKLHSDTIFELLDQEMATHAISFTEAVFDDIQQVLNGVFLLGELPEHSKNKIITAGEYLSASILYHLLSQQGVKAKIIDSKEFIKGNSGGGQTRVDYETTHRNISTLKNSEVQVIVAPGFVASDEYGKTITLGRGGSDFSAALFAAGLEAEILEIWTDVNGVYSADPKMVSSAVPIEQMSFNEAMELSHFGAKVIYTPTLHPLLKKKIRVLVKNTFEPQHPGTLISYEPVAGEKAIQGLSSIGGISLVTLSGSGMMGIAGISARFFEALAKEKLNVIMITQASSEQSICIALNENDAERAVEALSGEFAYEISVGTIHKLQSENGFTIISLVGENMINTKGICGKAFSSVGRNGINIHAIAQGSSELSVSFVVKSRECRKALNVLHEEFFLSSTKTINLYIAGVGNVGGKLLEIIRIQGAYLQEKHAVRLIVKGLCNSRAMLFNENGIGLDNWKDALSKGEKYDKKLFLERIKEQNLRNSIFIDNTASEEISKSYLEFLESHISVVTCNKIASSSEYGYYSKLKEMARKNHIRFLFESNVGAGLPILSTINNMLASGDEIIGIEGVLSGSVNFILNEFFRGHSFKESLMKAMEAGFTEPDPRIDLSGKDVARKLLILAREAGYNIEMKDISIQKPLPGFIFELETVNDFISHLPDIEPDMLKLRDEAQKEGNMLRFVASYSDGKADISLKAVNPESPFYHVDGKDNIVILKTKWYFNQPLVIKGAGAGPELTASGLMADIMQAAIVSN